MRAYVGLSAALTLLTAQYAAAEPRAEVQIADPATYPESITSLPDGTLIFGSFTTPVIYRAKPGEIQAAPWIRLRGEHTLSSLGVLADAETGTLWVCVSERSSGDKPPGKISYLQSFDLISGGRTASYRLPGVVTLCNDIALSPNGEVFANDTLGGRILKLDKRASALRVWLEDKRLSYVDGMTFMGATMFVNTITTNHIYRIPTDAAGKPGEPVEIRTSLPIIRPDGMRAYKGKLFIAENNPSNRVTMLRITGDEATVTVLREGLVTPTAVTAVGDQLWIGESKMAFLQDPTLNGRDPGAMRALAIPLPAE